MCGDRRNIGEAHKLRVLDYKKLDSPFIKRAHGLFSANDQLSEMKRVFWLHRQRASIYMHSTSYTVMYGDFPPRYILNR